MLDVNFEDAFRRTIGSEGGYVNDPNDPGGETKFGISKRQYPDLDISALTIETVAGIYRRDYWDALKCEQLPEAIREYLFDFGVNCGIKAAAEGLQGACGVLRDGDIGTRTIAAAHDKKPLDLIRILFVERAMIYALNQNDRRFGRGWFARLFDKTIQAAKEAK